MTTTQSTREDLTMSTQTRYTTVPAPARSHTTPVAELTDAQVAHPYRRHGLILTVGALSWAAGILIIGLNPAYGTLPGVLYGIGSGLFQIGLLFLLRVMAQSRALGTGRFARGYLITVAALVSVAIVSTTFDAIGLTELENPVFLIIDLCWPLSMLGMFTLAVRIAVAGRWSGVARFWPLLAESWALVTIPTVMVLGPDAARCVGGLHLIIGYAVLGLIVARKRA